MRLFDKILINTEELDAVEKVAVVSIVMFVVIFAALQLFFFICFTTVGVTEMAKMNFLSFIISLINLYFLIDMKKLKVGVYLLVTNFCFYVIFSTYLLGYNKNATMLYPIMILVLHTLFPKQCKYLLGSTMLIIIGFIINMYLKYNNIAKYTNELDYVELINNAFAFGAVFLFIYARSISEKIVKSYAEQMDKIAMEANVDFLTGLYNRRFIENRFLVEDFDESFIVLCDIDFFKKINDNYGHNCGDYIIKEVAQLLKHSFRPVDDVCRWGGEEFMVYIRNANGLDIQKKLEKVRLSIENTFFEYNNTQLKVTMSFGYCKLESDVEVKDNIEHADLALYKAKKTGRNKVVGFTSLEETKYN